MFHFAVPLNTLRSQRKWLINPVNHNNLIIVNVFSNIKNGASKRIILIKFWNFTTLPQDKKR